MTGIGDQGMTPPNVKAAGQHVNEQSRARRSGKDPEEQSEKPAQDNEELSAPDEKSAE